MRIFLILISCLFLATQTAAQSASTMIADEIQIVNNQQLIARGNVQIWHQGRRLKAKRISYNQVSKVLNITGPIEFTEGSEISIFAKVAELNSDLQSGIIQSAEFVLAQRLQITADQVNIEDRRYTSLKNVSATSCDTCGNNVPTWHIKASSVRHDSDEKQIYFTDARFYIYNLPIPILYVPNLRMPAPDLQRAAGFLPISAHTSSLLGFGVRFPYFMPIGDSRDILIQPYISPITKTLEYRYRQAFNTGKATFTGAISRDSVLPNSTRGYVFGAGSFNLPNDYNLDLNLEMVTDQGYLSDYNYSTTDRLLSFAYVSRVNAAENTSFKLSHSHSLRDGDDNATLPSVLAEGAIQRNFEMPNLAGQFSYDLQFLSGYRSSDLATDSADTGSDVDGYDSARLSFTPRWYNTQISKNGLVLSSDIQGVMDAYYLRQNQNYPQQIYNATALVATKLAYPLHKNTATGGSIGIKPQLQLVWAEGTNTAVPNQDSTQVEFDAGNLFALNRAPGQDKKENGAFVNIGTNAKFISAQGDRYDATLGRIMRISGTNSFSQTSGLQNDSSDWLFELQAKTATGVELATRNLIASNGAINKSENRLAAKYKGHSLKATHTWLPQDSDENRSEAISDLALNTSHPLSKSWSLSSKAQYDFIAKEFSYAGIGFNYMNECTEMNFDISRRFSNSANQRASTDFSFTFNFQGYNADMITGKSHKRCGETNNV